MKQTFFTSLLGGYNLGTFLGLIIWAFLGAFILMQLHAQKRSVLSGRTPVEFSWSFWLRDNISRIFLNLVMIVVVLRFFPDMFSRKPNELWALIIGLSSDGLSMLFTALGVIGKRLQMAAPRILEGGLPDQVKDQMEKEAQP